MASIVESGACVDDRDPFGSYSFSSLVRLCLNVTHRLPTHKVFQRLGLGLRKLVFWSLPKIIDIKIGHLSLRLYPWDNITDRQFLFLPQFVDYRERAFLKAHLPAQGTFVDIGANTGLYTLWASEILDDCGRILAFEPHPGIRRRLLFNLSLNPIKAHVGIVTQATSDKAGLLHLHFDPKNWGGSSLVRHQDSGNSIEVETEPLLSLIQKAGLSQIDVLKADIEGTEDRTLIPFFETAPRALWPRHLIIEDSAEQWENDLFLCLRTCGYIQQYANRMNIIFSLNDTKA